MMPFNCSYRNKNETQVPLGCWLRGGGSKPGDNQGVSPSCCCLLLQYLIQSCAHGGRRIVEDMFYTIRRAEACGGEYPEVGYMAVGSFLFLKEQLKDIIIIIIQCFSFCSFRRNCSMHDIRFIRQWSLLSRCCCICSYACSYAFE